MLHATDECYIYIKDGKELFTSNFDLASKRADDDTEIRIIKLQIIT
jgi:hypothetical protein